MGKYTFVAVGYDGPVGPTGERPLVSSVRLEEGPGHDTLHIWNRGGKAGTLTVNKGDGHAFVPRLFGMTIYRLEMPSVVANSTAPGDS